MFLFDDGNRLVRQIAPEVGATAHMPWNFGAARPAIEDFSVISSIDGRFYASRIGGDVRTSEVGRLRWHRERPLWGPIFSY